MSMTKDDAHQALDINIGRILEMFRRGTLALDRAEADLSKFFKYASTRDGPHLDVDLTRILERIRDGVLDADTARAELVKAAAASERNDPRAIDRLHHMAQ